MSTLTSINSTKLLTKTLKGDTQAVNANFASINASSLNISTISIEGLYQSGQFTNIHIAGGSINDTIIGLDGAEAGYFTTLSATSDVTFTGNALGEYVSWDALSGVFNISPTLNVTHDANLGNIKIHDNSISATNTNGDIYLVPNGNGSIYVCGPVVANITRGDFATTVQNGGITVGSTLDFNLYTNSDFNVNARYVKVTGGITVNGGVSTASLNTQMLNFSSGVLAGYTQGLSVSCPTLLLSNALAFSTTASLQCTANSLVVSAPSIVLSGNTFIRGNATNIGSDVTGGSIALRFGSVGEIECTSSGSFWFGPASVHLQTLHTDIASISTLGGTSVDGSLSWYSKSAIRGDTSGNFYIGAECTTYIGVSSGSVVPRGVVRFDENVWTYLDSTKGVCAFKSNLGGIDVTSNKFNVTCSSLNISESAVLNLGTTGSVYGTSSGLCFSSNSVLVNANSVLLPSRVSLTTSCNILVQGTTVSLDAGISASTVSVQKVYTNELNALSGILNVQSPVNVNGYISLNSSTIFSGGSIQSSSGSFWFGPASSTNRFTYLTYNSFGNAEFNSVITHTAVSTPSVLTNSISPAVSNGSIGLYGIASITPPTAGELTLSGVKSIAMTDGSIGTGSSGMTFWGGEVILSGVSRISAASGGSILLDSPVVSTSFSLDTGLVNRLVIASSGVLAMASGGVLGISAGALDLCSNQIFLRTSSGTYGVSGPDAFFGMSNGSFIVSSTLGTIVSRIITTGNVYSNGVFCGGEIECGNISTETWAATNGVVNAESLTINCVGGFPYGIDLTGAKLSGEGGFVVSSNSISLSNSSGSAVTYITNESLYLPSGGVSAQGFHVGSNGCYLAETFGTLVVPQLKTAVVSSDLDTSILELGNSFTKVNSVTPNGNYSLVNTSTASGVTNGNRIKLFTPTLSGWYTVTGVVSPTIFSIDLVTNVGYTNGGTMKGPLTTTQGAVGVQLNYFDTGFKNGFLSCTRGELLWYSDTVISNGTLMSGTLGNVVGGTVKAANLSTGTLACNMNCGNHTVSGTGFRINGGAIDSTPIGASTPASGKFSSLSVNGSSAVNSLFVYGLRTESLDRFVINSSSPTRNPSLSYSVSLLSVSGVSFNGSGTLGNSSNDGQYKSIIATSIATNSSYTLCIQSIVCPGVTGATTGNLKFEYAGQSCSLLWSSLDSAWLCLNTGAFWV